LRWTQRDLCDAVKKGRYRAAFVRNPNGNRLVDKKQALDRCFSGLPWLGQGAPAFLMLPH
jgi:hypothetical protein